MKKKTPYKHKILPQEKNALGDKKMKNLTSPKKVPPLNGTRTWVRAGTEIRRRIPVRVQARFCMITSYMVMLSQFWPPWLRFLLF